MRCIACGMAPSVREQTDVDAAPPEQVQAATAWVCTACRPIGYPSDGLCFGVLEVGGSSPGHEYGPELPLASRNDNEEET